MRTSGFIALVMMMAAAGLTTRTWAQQNLPAGGVRVSMVVTAEARHGTNPPPVTRDDVMVYQGKDRDQVTSWLPAQGEHAALELFILLDDSAGESLGSQLEDIRQFISSQPATTKVGVAYMQNGIAQMAQNLTADHAQAAKSVRLPLGNPGINASPYFSLTDLVKRWPSSNARREVVMVSDGIDRYYGTGDTQDPYVSEAIEQAQKAGIVVFAIYNPGAGHLGHSYWSNYWGQIYLSEVAERTGGESYYLGVNSAAVNFISYFDNVNHRLSNQYLLTFLAKPENKSGMQRVKLSTELSNTELVGADQVYVPASE
ncbi:MAG TPA: hypothetical protein VMT53_10565 [Terriglobales bacterium]|nr:hypothetical protein [Terriglobales bacterium]